MNASLVNSITEFGSRVHSLYRRVFSIEEIEQQPLLQWMIGASLFFFFITFSMWTEQSLMTVETAQNGNAVCWPYIPDCYKYYFLHDRTVDFSLHTFYMGLYALMLGIVLYMWQKKWTAVHVLLLTLFVWKALVSMVFTYSNGAPYHYYHLVLTAVLLFASHKEFFLKLSFVFLYFMSVTTKLHETWILGTYFTALREGLPIFSKHIAPLVTNSVIFMQMVGSWFLLSKHVILQRCAFFYFLTFHIFSGFFVGYVYPSVSLPSLIILFGPMYRHTPIPFSRRTLIGWIIIAVVGIFQVLGFWTPGDRRMSMEGNRFGMFMFEANHQCVIEVSTYYKGTRSSPYGVDEWSVRPGTECRDFFCLVEFRSKKTATSTVETRIFEANAAWTRCDPYLSWAQNRRRCDMNTSIERVSLQFDHSINGGPFYRIVNEPNVCELSYKSFVHNEWIKLPPDAPIVGYPVENTYNQ